MYTIDKNLKEIKVLIDNQKSKNKRIIDEKLDFIQKEKEKIESKAYRSAMYTFAIESLENFIKKYPYSRRNLYIKKDIEKIKRNSKKVHLTIKEQVNKGNVDLLRRKIISSKGISDVHIFIKKFDTDENFKRILNTISKYTNIRSLNLNFYNGKWKGESIDLNKAHFQIISKMSNLRALTIKYGGYTGSSTYFGPFMG